MTVSYFGLMALYFGAEFQSADHMKNFNVLVVDLDQGIIGMNYLNFTQQVNDQPGQINWDVHNMTRYPNISAIQEQVLNGNYWGAVVVQPNASANLNKAFAVPLPDYDPTKAFMFIYEGGRDPLVVKPYIVAYMYTQFLLFTKFFNPAWIKFLLAYSAQSNIPLSNLQAAPQVMGTPVAFEEFDLHPVTAPIITSATSVAYIWIFLVAGGSTYLVAHLIQPMTRNATVPKTMACLLLPLLAFLSALSMAYSLLLFVFGVPFPSGGSQFVSLFAGMLLLQCAVASMVIFLIYLIPVVFIPCFTITFVIMNVIAVFNPVELLPDFYKWVYAMPFLNAVQIARYVLMGSYNRLKYNIPVLATWILIPIVLLPFAISRQKRVAKEMEIQEEEEQHMRELRARQMGQQQQVVVKGRGHGLVRLADDDDDDDNDDNDDNDDTCPPMDIVIESEKARNGLYGDRSR
ncbi:hypothetical protein BC939DRAFT_434399 [Gamsiella multidivaricata]|uniref:uncharacterized protein n=1 Tax=Gamsiella multidivaricata TaxID=101098 RepID=UPI00221F8A07|nr:uncharacterized protein BC939DRAFT_434399 [Gamsiella multidivaricata]KAI7832801.1 hypothetical protein BC939DRAFT_434399 [Gamsiella multidivaricata]